MFQGRRDEADRRNREFGFDPRTVDAVVLSHAHIDHSGALPSLVRNGFQGSIHATLATADLCSVMLRDSAAIVERDLEFVNRRRAERGQPPRQPFYKIEDAEDAIAQLEGHRYHAPTPIVPGVKATFYDAGHILGSAIVQLEIEEAGRTRTLVFTGDLGRKGMPILRDPETPPHADAVIIESTYGNREHAPIAQVDDQLVAVVNRVIARGGKLIVPAFAVGRTQELVYALARLFRAGRLPRCDIFVDSPLAVNVTSVFARHPECYDAEIRTVMRETGDPFGLGLLRRVHDVQESKQLNTRPPPFVVISASGMCEAGRILHHLKNGIGDARNCVLIVGFQAEHTLGRRLVERDPVVKIFGEPHELRAEVVVMNEFSAHADRNELMAWMREFRQTPATVFVVHGEETQSRPFAARLETELGVARVVVPVLHESCAMEEAL
jgi:metallo-beta-lactamase family protein